ncbi:MAG: hypothetical protein ACP5XB_15370 [Isosphaeraceae bacterium]
MKRAFFTTALFLALTATSAWAQFNFVGPGSTVQGDYLRGVGMAAFGEGIYNYDTAMASSINANTAMRVNEYIYACLMNENRMNAEHRAAMVKREKDLFGQIRERIMKSPEARDVQTGDALNSVLQRMNGPAISESALREDSVPLSVEDVKRIPFKLAESGVRSFSMNRLTAKGASHWPIAFQDKQYAREIRAYELALDNALEQQYKGAMQMSAIEALGQAIDALDDRLREVLGASADKRYIEARDRLKQMRETVEMLKTLKIERALGDLDRYSGTTVNDLRVFMRNHNLQFADATNPEERNLYPNLYAKLKMQLEKVNGGIGVPDDAVGK